MALECLKIVLQMQNFVEPRPWTPLRGAYSARPKPPQLLLTPFAPSGHSGRLSHSAPSFEQMPFKFSDIFFLCWSHLCFIFLIIEGLYFYVFQIITSFSLLLVKCSVFFINVLLKFLLVDKYGSSTIKAFLASNHWSGVIVCR